MGKLYDEAEQFIKDVYWTESHDKGSLLNIPEVLASRLLKDNQDKDPEYYNYRPGVIHVSSLSKCLRGVVYEMLGTPKDEQDPTAVARKLGVFKAGNLFEDYIVEALSPWMLDRQTEYVYDLGDGVVLTGRDDGTIEYEGQRRMLECKSVHSDSFWHREKEGELVAYQNQMQIQTYLWLRRILPNVFYTMDEARVKEIIYTNMTKQALWEYRGMKPDDRLLPQPKPDENGLNGTFAYISKDDCTVIQAPVKFNPQIISETVSPALQWVMDAYLAKTPEAVPVPPLAVYNKSRGQWTKNWLCTYCNYHSKCAGAGWVMEAQAEVTRLNKEGTLPNPHATKAAKPLIYSVPFQEARTERIEDNHVLASAELGVDLATGKDETVVTIHQEGSAITQEVVESMVEAVLSAPAPTHPPIPLTAEAETSLERMLRETREKLEDEGIIQPKSGQ